MGGFGGIGGSSAKTDRATQLAAQQGQWGIFNQGMGMGQAGETTANQTLATAGKMLTMPRSAPAHAQRRARVFTVTAAMGGGRLPSKKSAQAAAATATRIQA